MTQANKMMCPDCGVEMNMHAEKVDYASGLEDAPGVDPVLGGRIEEAHACPACGKNLLRRENGEGEE